jgi:hypothetical protein
LFIVRSVFNIYNVSRDDFNPALRILVVTKKFSTQMAPGSIPTSVGNIDMKRGAKEIYSDNDTVLYKHGSGALKSATATSFLVSSTSVFTVIVFR